jgi:hypothetical protein
MNKIMTLLIPSLLGAASAGAAEPAGEVAIPFISSMSNVEWKAASDDSLYLRGPRGDWYFVRTSNRCTRLLTTLGIGFHTSALGQLDRHGAILAQGQRCPVASIVRSDGPPKKARHGAG